MPLDAAPPRVKAARPAATDGVLREAERALAPWLAPSARVCAGFSGGVDSVVLLDVLLALAPRHRWEISALHVNHQLQPQAAAWARFCRQWCRARGVPLRVVKVEVPHGDSIEAAARDARYAAYRAQPAEHVALAHHQDDQAETVLLQLLRGAGVKGLAAMPAMRADAVRADMRLLRPLLGVTRAEIETYATARRLQWVDDPSNGDAHYLRNFLRRDIVPRLRSRVPACGATLARAAAQMGEAAQLLDALAVIDGAQALTGGRLPLASLKALPAARARNLLRYFIGAAGVRMPEARRLHEALRQALTAKSAAGVRVSLGSHDLRCYRGSLYIVAQPPPPDATWQQPWHGEHKLDLPQWHGTLEMRRRRGAGIDLARLQEQPVVLRLRHSGEMLQPESGRPRRALKDLFQALGVPPWRRDRVPCLWSGSRLVWVAGVGIDCAFQAPARAAGVVPRWIEVLPHGAAQESRR